MEGGSSANSERLLTLPLGFLYFSPKKVSIIDWMNIHLYDLLQIFCFIVTIYFLWQFDDLRSSILNQPTRISENSFLIGRMLRTVNWHFVVYVYPGNIFPGIEAIIDSFLLYFTEKLLSNFISPNSGG